MVAITYAMNAGNPGDVNRTHPASISPERISSAGQPQAYGIPVLVSGVDQGMRQFATGDGAQAPFGFTVRPFPFNQQTTTQAYGASGFGSPVPPQAGIMDILRAGYIMAFLPFGGSPVKGGQAYVRVAASAGSHVMGAIEVVSDPGNNVALTGVTFNGTADANGNVELAVNI